MAASEAYASPEQMHPRQVVQSNGQIGYQFDIDKRTDIYSLGATFYHIMTGIKPNEGIRSVYPITELDIGYSEALKKIVDRAMRPNPDDRYQSASQMLTAVKNIYKSTAKYRAVRAGIVAGACCIGMLIGTSVVLGYKVSKKRKTERFEKDYSQVIQISAETEPELALERSISLLNDDDYSSVYNDNPTKKGTLLYQAALSYFVLEDYEEADKYFEEALDYINDPDCVRDYAISLAKGGDTYTAENVLRKNQDVLGEMNVRQIEAEILYVRGDYAEAEDNLEYVLQNTSNMADKCRNLILLSDVYAAQNKYDQMLQLVNDNNLPEEYASVREKILASAYIGLASEKEGSASDDYYKSAQTNLEKLKNNNLLDLDSAISLIVVYLNTGKLTEAENYLNVLSREYPNDYRVLVQQAFLDYNRQVSGEGDNYYFVTFKDHYEKAIKAYNEQNKDGKIDEKDVRDIGYPKYPLYTAGMNLGVSWKGFDFSMTWSAAFKTSRLLSSMYRVPFGESNNSAVMKYMIEDAWTPEKGNSAKAPALSFKSKSHNYQDSDLWLRDASYVRLKNIELGYSFPSSLMKKAHIGSLRLFVSGYNLLTFDKLKVSDPEANPDGTAYPLIKVVNVGLKVGF